MDNFSNRSTRLAPESNENMSGVPQRETFYFTMPMPMSEDGQARPGIQEDFRPAAKELEHAFGDVQRVSSTDFETNHLMLTPVPRANFHANTDPMINTRSKSDPTTPTRGSGKRILRPVSRANTANPFNMRSVRRALPSCTPATNSSGSNSRGRKRSHSENNEPPSTPPKNAKRARATSSPRTPPPRPTRQEQKEAEKEYGRRNTK